MKRTGLITEARASAVNAQIKAPVRTTTPPLTDFDTQLMLQLRAGNSEAATLLIRRNTDRVARFIGRILRNPRQVEDLTQDVFVQVLSNVAQYEPTAKFSTWLYRIATNTALNHLRRADVRRRKDTDPQDGETFLADRDDARPDRSASLEELRNGVAKAIGDLPLNQRIALTLFQYEELSYDQIAAILDTTVESVRALLRRARDTLREQLSGLL